MAKTHLAKVVDLKRKSWNLRIEVERYPVRLLKYTFRRDRFTAAYSASNFLLSLGCDPIKDKMVKGD